MHAKANRHKTSAPRKSRLSVYALCRLRACVRERSLSVSPLLSLIRDQVKGDGKMNRVVVDRQKVTPFLLRVFWCINDHYTAGDYHQQTADQEPIYPSSEAQVHTWSDCTLSELTDILKGVIPQARGKAYIVFSLVWIDATGSHVLKQIGKTYASKSGPDDEKTLASSWFITGDLLDVQVYNTTLL